MKIYIIAAMSADGFIAKSSDEFIDWTSPEDKQFFRAMTKKTGVIILGGNTFRTFKTLLPNRRHIVYSRKTVDNPDAEVTQESPPALISRLESENVTEVAICGGSEIYTMFLKSGLVTDLYLTIEPAIFGQGVKLFGESFDKKLKLVQSEKLNENTILNHYEVHG